MPRTPTSGGLNANKTLWWPGLAEYWTAGTRTWRNAYSGSGGVMASGSALPAFTAEGGGTAYGYFTFDGTDDEGSIDALAEPTSGVGTYAVFFRYDFADPNDFFTGGSRAIPATWTGDITYDAQFYNGMSYAKPLSQTLTSGADPVPTGLNPAADWRLLCTVINDWGSGSERRIYLDGTQVYPGASATNLDAIDVQPKIYLGRNGAGRFVSCKIADIAYWDGRALTPTEQANYKAEILGGYPVTMTSGVAPTANVARLYAPTAVAIGRPGWAEVRLQDPAVGDAVVDLASSVGSDTFRLAEGGPAITDITVPTGEKSVGFLLETTTTGPRTLTIDPPGTISSDRPSVDVQGFPAVPPASIEVGGTRCLMSRDAPGGDAMSNALDDATSFLFFVQLKLVSVSGSVYIFRLTNGGNFVLSATANTSGGNVSTSWYAYANNGTTNYERSIPSYAKPYTPGMAYTVAYWGTKVSGQWNYRLTINGEAQLFAFTPANPVWPGQPGYGNFGRAGGAGYQLEMGNVVGGTTYDYDNVALWKDVAPTDDEINGLMMGRIDPASYRVGDRVLLLSGDGTSGASVSSGDFGRYNLGGHPQAATLTTHDTSYVGTGPITYGPSLEPAPLVRVQARVMRGGETILFKLVPPEGKTLSGVGSVASPYGTIPVLPQIKVGAGPSVTPAHAQYYEVDGPTWLSVPVNGPLGFRGSPIAPSDTLTFSWPEFAVIALVDGSASGTIAYANEPIANASGDTYTLPSTRTFEFGVNTDPPSSLADWSYEGFESWDGAGIVDADGQLTDIGSGSGGRSTLRLNSGIGSNRVPAAMWSDSSASPAIPFGACNLPAGRYCIAMDPTSVFNWNGASSKLDRIVDYGVAPGDGPYAGLRISYCNISSITAVAGTGGLPHRIYFNVTWTTGTTGHACEQSVGGDGGFGFVRPTRAVQTMLAYEANGLTAGGLNGPRKGFKFYYLGPDPADPWFDPATPASVPEFNPRVIDNLAQARITCTRQFFSTIPPSVEGVPTLSRITRHDNPQRWVSIERPGNYTYNVAVSSVANYTTTGPDDYNEGFHHHPTNHGALLDITTAAPHNLTRGSAVYINGGSGSLPATGGLPNISWEGQRLVVNRVLSPTRILVYHDTSRGAASEVYLATSPTTSGLGFLGMTKTDGRLIPKESVRFAYAIAQAKGSPVKCWVNTPGSFGDAEVTAYATEVAQQVLLCPGQEVWIEFYNEMWNSIFVGFNDSFLGYVAMPGSGATFSVTVAGGVVTGATVTAPGSGYCYGSDYYYDLSLSGGGGSGAVLRARVVNGAFTSVDVIAAGSSYTSAPTATLPAYNALPSRNDWAVMQTYRMRKFWEAAFTAAGVPLAQLKTMLPCQGYYGNVEVDCWNKAGFPVTRLVLATTNYTFVSRRITYVDPPFHEPDQWKTQTLLQRLDQVLIYLECAENTQGAREMRAYMDAHGFASVPIFDYEQAFEEVLAGSTLSYQYPYDAAALRGKQAEWAATRELLSHPRWYEVIAERARIFQPYVRGGNHFYYAHDPEGAGDRVVAWGDPWNQATRIGRGLGPSFAPGPGMIGSAHDNRTDLLATDANEWVMGAAWGDWSSAGSGPSPDDPTSASLWGPGSGPEGYPAIFWVALNRPATEDVTVNRGVTGGSGSFAPASLTIPAGSVSSSFIYTPAVGSSGNHLVSITTFPPLSVAGSPATYAVHAPAPSPSLPAKSGYKAIQGGGRR